MLSKLSGIIAAILWSVAAAHAQTVMTVGDLRVDPHFVLPAHCQFDLMSTENGQVKPLGVLVEDWTESTVGGRRVLIKDSLMESEGSREHLVVDRDTMAPISISLTTRNRQNDLTFAGTHVAGTASFRGDKKNVSIDLSRAQFAGNTFYLVLRSLPLSEGMARTVKFFRAFDLQEVEVTFTVLASDEFVRGDEKEPVWFVMTKEKNDSSLGLYWIRKSDHGIARIVTFSEGGQQMTMLPRR